jgi:hypothetical protein
VRIRTTQDESPVATWIRGQQPWKPRNDVSAKRLRVLAGVLAGAVVILVILAVAVVALLKLDAHPNRGGDVIRRRVALIEDQVALRDVRAILPGQSRYESDGCVTGTSGVGPESNLAYAARNVAGSQTLAQVTRAFEADRWAVSPIAQRSDVVGAAMTKSFDGWTAYGRISVQQRQLVVNVNVSDGVQC